MGIEEDNIRKHTTPAYRAPEVYIENFKFEPFFSLFHIFIYYYMLVHLLQMWDLYRREIISEKVDIWVNHLCSYHFEFWFYANVPIILLNCNFLLYLINY